MARASAAAVSPAAAMEPPAPARPVGRAAPLAVRPARGVCLRAGPAGARHQGGPRHAWSIAALGGAALVAGGRRRQGLLSAAQRRSGHRLVRRACCGEAGRRAPVPVVLLSGFLGTGKTTLLKHWLENSEGRIGVVVNDVASVNIDAKLVDQQRSSASGAVDMIQMQNGCACCSLGDEFITTIYDLLELADGDEPFSQIVVELSGIAEPRRIREHFLRAELEGYKGPVDIEMSKVVTMIDSSTFCKDYMEYNRLYERPDLMEDDSGQMADCKVVELLVEQVEDADVVVLNKTDLAESDTLPATRAVIKALNAEASMRETSFGRVSLNTVLTDAKEAEREQGVTAHTHEEAGHAEHCCESHSHEGHHQETHANDAHGHCCHEHEAHEHGRQEAHNHSPECHNSACHDADCTDPSCGHTHSHSSATTAEDRFGITSFIYAARRPFHSERLAEILQRWPVPNKDCLGQVLSQPPEGEGTSPFGRVIRSKGFCWLDAYPSSRMYWSHAGKSLALEFDDPWWGAIPEDMLRIMDEAPKGDYARAKQEDWSEEWGDRRQEIVFIGQKMDEERIRDLLDGCLLKDGAELEEYREKQAKDTTLSSMYGYQSADY